MRTLFKAAQAGTVESGDILIMVAPASAQTGIVIELVSPTMQQFGDQIKEVITNTIIAHGIEDMLVHANDKGAWDYTIEARVKSAIARALH